MCYLLHNPADETASLLIAKVIEQQLRLIHKVLLGDANSQPITAAGR